jgi:phosphoribosylglycinamide formyltransferase-1
MKNNIVVLISGNGSNLQAIIDACTQHELNAEIAAVISNKENAFGLERARLANIPAITKMRQTDQDRKLYDKELADCVANYNPEWIVLAGWMHLLSNHVLQRFPGKIINLHPALPGTFPGTKAIERAFNAFSNNKITHTGVMVHFVPDEGVDSGPVILQENVSISNQDTLESLSERVHAVERKLLVNALKKLIE